MTSKERIKATLNHKQPDRVCIDFGATPVTGMHCSIVAELRDYLELENKTIKIVEPHQMLGEIDEELKNYLGGDVEGYGGQSTIFGYDNVNFKEWKTPWGQNVLVGENFQTSSDNNNTYIYPEGDMSVPPSGRMPKSSFHFDAINRQKKIDESKLNYKDNLEEFKILSNETLAEYKAHISNLKTNNRAILSSIGGTGVGDIALVPGTFLKDPKGIRDISEWYMSTALRTDYLHSIFTPQTDIALENIKKIYSTVGNDIDIFYICGTDFGTQTSSFCSVETYEELYAPYYKKMNNWIHKNTEWKTMKHSCGAVKDFIPSFIDSGFDILNPVQCSATGMDPLTLKKEFGSNIVFWGGATDTQKTLPFGTPEDVRKETLKRCEIFSKDGGFVFNSIHNIQANTPIKNVVAFIDAVKDFNGGV